MWKSLSDSSGKDNEESGNMAAAAGKMYYDLEDLAGLSTLSILQAAARQRKPGISQGLLTAWLEKQEASTLLCPVRKRFQRNPFTVNNIMDVSECDLVDMHSLSKYNEGVR